MKTFSRNNIEKHDKKLLIPKSLIKELVLNYQGYFDFFCHTKEFIFHISTNKGARHTLFSLNYLRHGKECSDHLLPLPDPLAGEAGGGDWEKRGPALARNTFTNQGLPRPRGTKQEQTFRRASAIIIKFE